MGNFSKVQVLELNVWIKWESDNFCRHTCIRIQTFVHSTHLQKINLLPVYMKTDFKISAYPELISLKDKFGLRAETIISKIETMVLKGCQFCGCGT